jgi:phosphomethylpyrimidine synthase
MTTTEELRKVKLNCNIGCNSEDAYYTELEKIRGMKDSGCIPDMMMDLSLYRAEIPLYKYIQEILNIPVGTVLAYIPFSKENGLEWNECQNYLIQLGKDKVNFVTIHFTANAELLEIARRDREIPVTSRGGAMCLYDIEKNSRKQNLFLEHFNEIIAIAKQYDMTISLGATFRPSNIFDTCDEVHIKETEEQLQICRCLQKEGVNVMVENVGHISLDKIEKHANLLRQFDVPIMPLGPIPTDTAIGQDHISAAIGSAFLCYHGCADIINCVTRYEHTGDEITADSIIESVKAMRVVAQTINVYRGFEDAIENEKRINRLRANNRSCVIGNGQCDRCQNVCPLKLI